MLRRFILTFMATAIVLLSLEVMLVMRLSDTTSTQLLGAEVVETSDRIAARYVDWLYRTACRLPCPTAATAAADLRAFQQQRTGWVTVAWRPDESAQWVSVGPSHQYYVDIQAGPRGQFRLAPDVSVLRQALWGDIPEASHIHCYLMDGDTVVGSFPEGVDPPVLRPSQLVPSQVVVAHPVVGNFFIRSVPLQGTTLSLVTQQRMGAWMFEHARRQPLMQIVQWVVFTGVLILAAWWLARQIVGPLRQIRKGVHRMAQGDLDARIELRHDPEIRDLASDINLMAAQLQQRSETRNRFFANVSHELRTPLTAIVGYTDLLRQDLGATLDEAHRAMLGKIAHNGAALLSLINELLDMSRIDAGRLELHIEQVVLQECLESAWTMVAPQAQQKGLAFEADLPDEPVVLPASFERLRQVFVNLLSNAVRFTDQGSLGVRLKQDDASVSISVWDTGIGLNPDIRIFEEFQQADSTIEGRYGGTGLGLAISRRLVELHGGDLSVASQPGQGATFTVRLPRSVPGGVRAARPPVESERSSL